MVDDGGPDPYASVRRAFDDRALAPVIDGVDAHVGVVKEQRRHVHRDAEVSLAVPSALAAPVGDSSQLSKKARNESAVAASTSAAR